MSIQARRNGWDSSLPYFCKYINPISTRGQIMSSIYGCLNQILSRSGSPVSIWLIFINLGRFFFCFIFRAFSLKLCGNLRRELCTSQSSFHFYCLVFQRKDFMLMVIMLEEFLFDLVHTYNIMTSVVEYHFRVYKN